MLVLSRKKDEKIVVGENIEITVVDIRADRVRLGIQAPADVTIHRKEVSDAIALEISRETKEETKTVPQE